MLFITFITEKAYQTQWNKQKPSYESRDALMGGGYLIIRPYKKVHIKNRISKTLASDKRVLALKQTTHFTDGYA